MSDDRIEEIRARHRKRSEIDQSGCYRLDGFTYMGSLSQSQEDVATLLAEVEKLRASLKQFRCSCDPGECVEYGERWSSVCEKGEARDVLEGKQ